jgi:hypothetical protein
MGSLPDPTPDVQPRSRPADGPVPGGLLERLLGPKRAAAELRRVRRQERRDQLLRLTDPRLEPGTMRCRGCDPLVCGIDPCPGHDAWERHQREQAEASRRRQERRRCLRRLRRRWRRLYGPVVADLVREVLAAELPAAVAVLQQRRAGA